MSLGLKFLQVRLVDTFVTCARIPVGSGLSSELRQWCLAWQLPTISFVREFSRQQRWEFDSQSLHICILKSYPVLCSLSLPPMSLLGVFTVASQELQHA